MSEIGGTYISFWLASSYLKFSLQLVKNIKIK